MTTTTVLPEPADTRRVARRRGRYAAQRIVWDITRLKRVAYCGRVVADRDAGVTLKVTAPGTPEARAGFSGLMTCGSVWACPVCAEKVNAHRQQELERGINAHIKAGGAVLFGTLTVRHDSGDELADMLAAISPAWNKTTSGSSTAWNGGKMRTRGPKKGTREIGDKERFGIVGYVRLLEVKWGHANGWHPHVHYLLFLSAELTASQVNDLGRRMFGRWQGELARHGYSTEEWCSDLKPISGADVAGYFTKSAGSAAFEVTGSQSKNQGGSGSYTPFELLRRVAVVEDERGGVTAAQALVLWRIWEQVSKGRRQLTWSRGLRTLLRLDVELTDEEVVDLDLGGDVVDVIETACWYDTGLAYRRVSLLEAAEAGDFTAYGGAAYRSLVGSGSSPPG